MTLSDDRKYQEIHADIRATDEISFKLMGLVPLAAVAAFLTLFLEDKARDHPHIVVALSLFSALITLGLFRWELRNIQICRWLLQRSEVIEATDPIPARPKPPSRVGKTEAEIFVYSVTIFAWLSMPVVVCARDEPWLQWICGILALLVAVGTAWWAWTSVRVGGDGEKNNQK